VTLFVVLVAGGSLTVSVAAGLIERRRPFALLRAGGARPGQLRRVLLTETAVPMAATVTLGAAFGLAASYGFWDSRGRPWPAPDLGLAVLLGGGVLSAMVVTLLTLPMVNAATGYDAVRYE
jgi:ABC-type antimicrobial peptide transport system permease subunit